jgi:hypothetical protein
MSCVWGEGMEGGRRKWFFLYLKEAKKASSPAEIVGLNSDCDEPLEAIPT